MTDKMLDEEMKTITTLCAFCKKPFTDGQYVYEVKETDGGVVFSHGYPCVPVGRPNRKVGIQRISCPSTHTFQCDKCGIVFSLTKVK